MTETDRSEERRTTALAYWRYAHEYLRAARTLCNQHRLPCEESQATYHLTAQALEFAFKSFLRTCGIAADVVVRAYSHRLEPCLDEAVARGLAPPPATFVRAVRLLGPHHRGEGFTRIDAEPASFPEMRPLFDAVHWILDAIVPVVVQDYVAHHSRDASPSKESFIFRLRADLSATLSDDALPA